MSFATTADDAGPTFGRRLIELAPGIVLLLAIGYSGKLIEQTIAAYGKANHLALPNIEYVLWAIVIGLIIANTVGVPKIFRAGVATYEFWLKLGIVLLGVRFLLGDVLKLGGISLVAVALELTHLDRADDLARQRVPAHAEAHQPARDRLLDLRRLGDHRRQGRDQRQGRGRVLRDRGDPGARRDRAVRLSGDRPPARHERPRLWAVGRSRDRQHGGGDGGRQPVVRAGRQDRGARQDHPQRDHRLRGARLRDLLGDARRSADHRATRAPSCGRNSRNSCSAFSSCRCSRPWASSPRSRRPTSPTCRAGPSC